MHDPDIDHRYVRWCAAVLIGCAILLIVGGILFLSCGCGSATADDLRAVEVRSPVGVQCYAIVQGGQAVGGSCLELR